MEDYQQLKKKVTELQHCAAMADKKLSDTKIEYKRRLSEQKQLLKQLQSRQARPDQLGGAPTITCSVTHTDIFSLSPLQRPVDASPWLRTTSAVTSRSPPPPNLPPGPAQLSEVFYS